MTLEKRGITTLEAISRIARSLKVPERDFGYAGMKDAIGITRQTLSIQWLAVDKALALQLDDIKILAAVRHTNKLKTGHLKGNRFIIRLRVAPGTQAIERVAERARSVLDVVAQKGFPNYFGPQRFGRGGNNVQLGRLLVLGDLAEFERLHTGRLPDRRLRNLLVNAFQADLFNRVLSQRVPQLNVLQAGDVAWLHRNGACFSIATPEEAQREQVRADQFEISPSGPLFGPKMLRPTLAPDQMEQRVLQEAGVSMEAFGSPSAERQPGARRPLRVPLLEAPQVEVEESAVLLRFALPSGSYASVVLAEITGQALDSSILPAD